MSQFEIPELRPQDVRLLRSFIEATKWDRSGEVVLRSGNDTGRAFFAGGRVAWVCVSTIKRTFTEYLADHSKLSREEVSEVFEDCKRTGKPFGETIVEWELLDENSLRLLLLQHIAECLLEILSWGEIESMFMPEDRPYKGSLTFSFGEILQTALILDTTGRLPFSGSNAGDIIRAVEEAAVDEPGFAKGVPEIDVGPGTEPEARFDDTTARELMPAGMTNAGPGAAGAAQPLGPDGAQLVEDVWMEGSTVNEPFEEPEPEKKKGKGKWVLLILFLLLAGGGVAFYFYQDPVLDWIEETTGWDLRGGETTDPSEPEPLVPGTIDAGQDEPATDIAAGTREESAAVEDGGIADAAAPDAGEEKAPPEGEPLDLTGIIHGGPGKGAGAIRVTSRPSRAPIYLDGVFTGKLTPAVLKRIPAGVEHVVLVEKKGRRPGYKKIKLRKGKTARMKLLLKRGRKGKAWKGTSTVTVVSEPEGAAIFVDGEKSEQATPAKIELRRASASKLELKLEGHEPWVKKVRPVPEEELSFLVKLTKSE